VLILVAVVFYAVVILIDLSTSLFSTNIMK